MHGIQRFSKHLLAHCWQYWEISSNFIFLNACRSIPLDMLMPVFVRQFSRDSISKSSKHSKNIVSPWCLCANQQFSQECRAANISVTHSVFFAKKTSKLANSYKIANSLCSPCSLYFYTTQRKSILLSSLQSKWSPPLQLWPPQSVYWWLLLAAGGSSLSCCCQGIWGRMDREGRGRGVVGGDGDGVLTISSPKGM